MLEFRKNKRYVPGFSATLVNIAVAAFIVLCANSPFWHATIAKLGLHSFRHWVFLLVVGVSLVILFNLFLSAVSFRPIHKPLLVLLLLVTASVSYFMTNYGVIIDSHMIHNVLETDFREATELATWPLLVHLLLWGLLPSALLLLVRIPYRPWRRELMIRTGVILGSTVLLAGLVISNFKELSLFGRENKNLRLYINPTYPIYSVSKVVATTYGSYAHANVPIKVVAADAKKTSKASRTVVVLVVGETARSEQFSMNGYQRNTNPKLNGLDVINFADVASCGTETAVSLPCMFSHLGRERYSRNEANVSQNLLDILQRTGVRILWRDNNSGSKGVSNRVPYEDVSSLKDAELCPSGECYDEILLKDLGSALDEGAEDLLVVLHQKGSHGPSYYKRTPSDFKPFTPECTQDNIQDCDRQSIINAYDNTIVYTDHVLAKLIALLNSKKFPTAMLYVSDHGESLGENNLYLHGLPYVIAPHQQTHVPMVFWASSKFLQERDLDPTLLKQHGKDPLSHDFLFHSMLGLYGVKTDVYRSELDMFSKVRNSLIFF